MKGQDVVISLLVIVAALLGTNLYALASSKAAMRIPFAVAAVALGIAMLGPFAGVLHVPLPSQFLLLWLLIIPMAVICAVAATLVGMLAVAGQTYGAKALSRRWWGTIALPTALIVAVAGQELVVPASLLRAPVQGIEISTGTVVGDTRYGASFSGAVGGALAGNLVASVNYRPAYPRPGISHTVIGGNWSLAVYKSGHYVGTLFGSIRAGTVRWNLDVTMASTAITLRVAGGTGSYLGAHGRGQFSGSLLHTTYPPAVGGELRLELR